MSKNLIIDYEEALDKIKEISSKGIIKREEPLAITENGLPIEYLTVGKGNKDIVITGSTHGCEIISTDFVLRLMDEIDPNNSIWGSILNEFRIHFMPMLNPEGYLISTSAVRKLIPRDMSSEDAEKICKEYFLAFRKDMVEPCEYKRYQKMFENIDYRSIDDKYEKVKESVRKIYEKYKDIPKGTMQIWSANGNGIDIQSNNINNPKVEKIMNGEDFYMASKRYDNIKVSHPGPINCPFDKEKGFKIEIETKAISDLLERLNKNNSLFMYLNYHSAGGIVYQRPAIKPEDIDIDDTELSLRERMNYIMAKAYSSKTYKNDSNYGIIKSKDNATSSNDIFRIKYPNDLLIELSPMGGNPIAPYGDIEGNYKKVISSNIDAVKHTLYTGALLKKISEEFDSKLNKINDGLDYDSMTEVEDMIYKEFSNKTGKL